MQACAKKFAPVVREATVCHACDTKQRAPAVPAFLRGRDDYEWQEVLFRRPATDSPLGLGLERMGLGDAAAESIVVDEMVRGGVVDCSGAMQLGSLVHSVHGRVVVDGWSGCSEPGSFGALLEGIRSAPDVRLGVLRPSSLDCLLACAVALRRQELAHLVGASRTRSLRLALLRLLAAGGGDGHRDAGGVVKLRLCCSAVPVPPLAVARHRAHLYHLLQIGAQQADALVVLVRHQHTTVGQKGEVGRAVELRLCRSAVPVPVLAVARHRAHLL